MKRYLPLFVFVLVTALGIGMTTVVYRAEVTAEQKRFEIIADEAVDSLQERLRQHVALLFATRALFSATNGEVDGRAFKRFVAGLGINDKYAGIQGIGYASFIPVGEEIEAQLEISANYALGRAVWPETDQTHRTPIVLLEPQDERNKTALGYDMYQEPSRRAAIMRALQTGEASVSAPVELVQEITSHKQAGFLVYLPFGQPQNASVAKEEVRGFVYAPFRAGDLHLAALSAQKTRRVALKTSDHDRPLFETANFAPDKAQYTVTRELDFAGRVWTIELHETSLFYQSAFPHLSSMILGTLSAILAFALAIATVAQQNAVRQAQAVRRVVEETLKEKEMLLQEMRHRIKNSIARVLAISRQTANGAENIEEFTKSFNARLHAMSKSQDLLTRSKWQRADLKTLLSAELEQVFGEHTEYYEMDGPKIELNEQATQAIGLVCHELATNALKYGGITEPGGKLSVTWKTEGKKARKRLHLNWREYTQTPVEATKKAGFGTKLIDANIRGELRGEIERTFEKDGLKVTIDIPLNL
ncbi:CHASE domain-containing protein [Maritalea mediterranea]|uniref:histidine kinase n=1 Tax=Maritalea mediterranea TaxID=2909667 RepID=A0ABS9ECL3_9HYPH|nr:CHASE domain-containing protein [Maritalea mediterranea]MCF4099196.1 CHASE domain-containing protein [Maritalea mediterranea]